MLYLYGMRMRGVSLGAQPKNFYDWSDGDKSYHNYISYERELTPEEISQYELVFIGERQ